MRVQTFFVAAAVSAAMVVTADAAPLKFNQGFETDTAGWFDSTDYGAGYGTITRVATGYGEIVSAGGGYHAVVTDPDGGPFTRFGGYSSTWLGDYAASIDVYLDTAWAAGSGFDYSVASSNSSGAHRRDFIFHIAKDTSTGDLLVGGSNNSGAATREDLDSFANRYKVETSGWYTLKHGFRNDGGVLAVDLMLYSGNTLLFTETRRDANDLIPTVVGGNRYGWFTHVTVSNGLAIDNVTMTDPAPVPEPGTMTLLGLGLAGIARKLRKRA